MIPIMQETMMQTNTSAAKSPSLRPNSVQEINGELVVDVQEMNCPTYLLAVNNIVSSYKEGTQVRLLLTYPRCENEIKAWCHMKGYDFLGQDDMQENFSVRFKIA